MHYAGFSVMVVFKR